MSPAQELAVLLAESERAARERAMSAFERARGDRPVVLVGAGNLGRRVASAMRATGNPPIAFADGQRALHFTKVEGIEVHPVESAVQAFPEAAFVITIWGARSNHRIAQTAARLRELGATCVIPFTHLLWSLESLVPYYFIDRPDHLLSARADVTRAFELFAEDASRAEFVSQIRARLTGELGGLGEPVRDPQYHARGLFTYRDGEMVLDGGAFDADTLRDWLQLRGTTFARWLAVEPDRDNATRFREYVAGMPADVQARTRLSGDALGAQAGAAQMDGAGAAARLAAGSAGASQDAVTVTTIEALTRDEHASFIKLDIEGAEQAALEGGRNAIARDRPVLAVCAYHRLDDLYALPLLIAKIVDRYEFFLRPHGAEGWDLVLYAVPQERRP